MSKKLFIPGPIDVNEDILSKMATQVISHRGKEASKLQEEITEKLQKLFYTDNSILLSTSSGSWPNGRLHSLLYFKEGSSTVLWFIWRQMVQDGRIKWCSSGFI